MEAQFKTTLQELEAIVDNGGKLTPMMEQYYQIKKQYPDTLLLFRMGDFYELFFDDARVASAVLNIALTHRGKIAGTPIPMAGIPHHAATTYIDRITSQGMKAAICEQVEDPKEAKGIVKRAVTQVVSPGMPFDLEKTGRNENRFMGCAFYDEENFYLVFIDYTTGEFFGQKVQSELELIEMIQIYSPHEFISYLGQWDQFERVNDFFSKISLLKTNLSQDYFEAKYSSLYIEKLIPGFKRDETLKNCAALLCPIGALAYYICSTQAIESLAHIRPFKLINTDTTLKITYPTLVGLEIFPKNRENYSDSILGFVDKTKTSMGVRKLKSLFLTPLRSLSEIEKRYALIDFFISKQEVLSNLRQTLQDIRDIDRVMAKVTSQKANGGDLINLAQAINAFLEIHTHIGKNVKAVIPSWKKSEFEELKSLSLLITKTINDTVGASLEKGNLIKEGASKQRDRLANLTQNTVEELVKLETQYRKKTGISNLRIKSNNVAGYFIEVSKSHLKKVPKNFVRRQTLVNNERYTTEELDEFEKEMISAKDKLYRLEKSLFQDLIEKIISLKDNIIKCANSIALIDSFQSMAWIAIQENFVRPQLFDKKILHVKNGWHPLIKANIKDQFVAHNLQLDSSQFFGLITGPNMAGKTTVMREMAIIQFLAQVGSFVPAKEAKLGLCDFLFSRLGASDDIVKGQSTFMVEMSETAEIIRHASDRSLIILDEIGRGTSTFDGLSIAWALVEYLNEKTKSICLFSTHYHELIDLVKKLPTAKNLTVKTVNYKGKVQFLYTLIKEGATQSFGIHVAELAGLPREILNRSQEILSTLETNTSAHQDLLSEKPLSTLNQLSFLADEPSFHIPEYLEKLEREIHELDLLNMTPIQAMAKLDHLKNEIIRH